MKLDPEDERILAMSETELRAEVAADGLDWDTEIAKVTAAIERGKAEAEMRLAIKAWLKCPVDKRPTPAALGQRIAEIASAFSSRK